MNTLIDSPLTFMIDGDVLSLRAAASVNFLVGLIILKESSQMIISADL